MKNKRSQELSNLVKKMVAAEKSGALAEAIKRQDVAASVTLIMERIANSEPLSQGEWNRVLDDPALKTELSALIRHLVVEVEAKEAKQSSTRAQEWESKKDDQSAQESLQQAANFQQQKTASGDELAEKKKNQQLVEQQQQAQQRLEQERAKLKKLHQKHQANAQHFTDVLAKGADAMQQLGLQHTSPAQAARLMSNSDELVDRLKLRCPESIALEMAKEIMEGSFTQRLQVIAFLDRSEASPQREMSADNVKQLRQEVNADFAAMAQRPQGQEFLQEAEKAHAEVQKSQAEVNQQSGVVKECEDSVKQANVALGKVDDNKPITPPSWVGQTVQPRSGNEPAAEKAEGPAVPRRP